MQFLLYTKTLEKLHSHKKIPGKVLKFCSYQNGRNLVFVLKSSKYLKTFILRQKLDVFIKIVHFSVFWSAQARNSRFLQNKQTPQVSNNRSAAVIISCGPPRGGRVLRGKKDRDERRKSKKTTLKLKYQAIKFAHPKIYLLVKNLPKKYQ